MKYATVEALDWQQWVNDPDHADLETMAERLRSLDGPADASGLWPAGLWSILTEHRVPGWSLPIDLGGAACGRLLLLKRYARIAEASLTAAFVLSQHDAGIRRLLAARERSVARDWLSRIASGTAFVTVGISQLTTSRRLGDHAVVAEPDGPGRYRIRGAMPWVTAAERADVIVAGAAMADGEQMLIALPTTRAGVSAQPSFPLAAVGASRTAEVLCEDVEVCDDDLLVGPMPNVMSHPGAAGTGGLETSALAFGQARAAIRSLADELKTRPELTDSVEALAESWRSGWNDMVGASEERPAAPAAGKIRAEANALVLRATQAYLTSRKGSGFIREEPAQRWARQALFFLVWSCPSPVARAVIEDLAGICDA